MEILRGMISTAEAMELSSYSAAHLRRLLADGKIKGHKMGPRFTVYSRDSIMEYLASDGPLRTWAKNPAAAAESRRLSAISKAASKAVSQATEGPTQ